MLVFVPILQATQSRRWHIWVFDHHWICRPMALQTNVQPTVRELVIQWAVNSSPLLLFLFLFHFLLLLGVSCQVDAGGRNKTDTHPFVSKLVTLRIWIEKIHFKKTKRQGLGGNTGQIAPCFPFPEVPTGPKVSPLVSASSSKETDIPGQLRPVPGSPAPLLF